MVEVEKSYASKGVAGTALGLGIAGTALGALGSGMSGLFGGRAATCSENMPVSRYEQEQQAKIAKLEADVALRDANTYGDKKMLEMYQYIDSQLKDIRSTIGQQAVHNQRTEDSFVLVRQDVFPRLDIPVDCLRQGQVGFFDGLGGGLGFALGDCRAALAFLCGIGCHDEGLTLDAELDAPRAVFLLFRFRDVHVGTSIIWRYARRRRLGLAAAGGTSRRLGTARRKAECRE